MAGDEEAARLLAEQLRTLRITGFAGVQIKQSQLGVALGVSVPLVSSWERIERPTIPGPEYLEKYARFFATERSMDGGHPVLLPDNELIGDERDRRRELESGLLDLRAAALGLPTEAGEHTNRLRGSIGAAPWRFPVGEDITIVSSKLPPELLAKVPSSDRFDPDYVESYRYADLDSMFELHGHIRAVNPDNLVRTKIPEELADDDRSTHLVLLGGVDWNLMTGAIMRRVGVPIRQAKRAKPEDLGAFEVTGQDRHLEPQLDESGALIGDVAHFLRAPNPFNKKRTVTICNALYGLGVYGVVRALTDARFRDRNAEYLAQRFKDQPKFSILCHVPILAGGITVPDWTEAGNRLHEWSGADE